MSDVSNAIDRLRLNYRRGITRPLSWRVQQLSAISTMLRDHKRAFIDALSSDLGKGELESQVSELGLVENEIKRTIRSLHRWTRSTRAIVPWWLQPSSARVVLEPYGVVLVISPWNFPVLLLLLPAVGALAAGNAVLLKPSELAPATARLFAEIIPKYLSTEAVSLCEGGPVETAAILEERFDFICATGSPSVGRIVMTAAAKHLTPVLLELGGKCPTFVDRGVDLDVAARRIAIGKFLNAGQACVAVDYVLAEPDVAADLERRLVGVLRSFYSNDPATSPDFGRIVNDAHFDRLVRLLECGRVLSGGRHSRIDRYIEPTILVDVQATEPIMEEEIFGPILPILGIKGVSEAIEFINSRPKPLALYVFTDDRSVKERFIKETSSGAIGFGLPAIHFSIPSLPLGGIGESGMGAYHGKFSIETFSHRKSILDKSLHPDTMRFGLYPPYSGIKKRFLRRLF